MRAHEDITASMAAGPALAELLRTAVGSVGQRIDRALTVLVEQLGMEVAYVSEFRAGERVVTHSVSRSGGPVLPVGTTHPVEETLCHLVATGDLPVLVGDAAADPVMGGHPHTLAFGVAAHAGVPLAVEGRVRGALCCAATTPARTLNPRDEATLNAVAGYLTGVLTEHVGQPAEPGLRRLAAAVAAGRDLQSLTRPLLQLLQDITGLESTFLTMVDTSADELVVAYAHNSGDLVVAEGSTSSWQESLCRRALEEGRAEVTDVPATWPGAATAQQTGITSFVSVPVRDAHDELLGTLCGASSSTTPVGEQNLAIMKTFAQLLSAQLARETAHHLQAARATVIEQRMNSLREAAERDSLTGLCNRAGINRWLHKALDGIAVGGQRLAVAFIDLDRFKSVNDTYGHATGDEVLRRLAASLARTGRAGDLHGRLGGDEFIVAALLPAEASVDGWTARVRAAAVAVVDDVQVGGSVGVVSYESAGPATSVEYVLDQADRAMYREKHAMARTT
ncbi:sensor domain-containing diguanylate cyclase [Actinoplanes utahensis]|uniref:sensor domain-containing diguanylate cyclase n=1 Tax=Actinoplanes utahensis TaxID=1869 RepID=UPI001269D273|nr:diguanylate cyclase [Actinoplanes utahensis]